MPTSTPGAAIVLTASQIRGVTIGFGVIMIVVGIGGLAVSLATDEDIPPLRIAYTSAFIALLVGGMITIVVATLRGLAAVIKHQAGIERAAVAHFAKLETMIKEMIAEEIDDGLHDRLNQIEHLMVTTHGIVERHSTIIADVFAEQIKRRDDEIARRRERRNG